MMHRVATVAYRRASGFQVVRLPYSAGLAAMYLVLPDDDMAAMRVLEAGRPTPCPPISRRSFDRSCTRIRISDAAQNVFLDVDEVGTEAAAVTVVEGSHADSAGPPPIQFVVDRPFLFAIRDERTGTLLFIGYVANLAR